MKLTEAAHLSRMTGDPFRRSGKEPILKADVYNTKRVDLDGAPPYSFAAQDLCADDWELITTKIEVSLHTLKKAWEEAVGSSKSKKFILFCEKLGMRGQNGLGESKN